MSRRGRALAFLLLALLAALAAALLAERYGSRAARGYGPLRPVVVVESGLAAGSRLGPRQVAAALGVRRVPARFVPAGALAVPAQALGLVARAALSPGSYLLATQLGPPRRGRRVGGGLLRGGRRPVEIAVSGAGALLAAPAPAGSRVDVVVTGEPTGPGPGRTYVAAAAVPLLALRADREAGAGLAAATLGLTRRQALRLIAAESFARKVTLLPGG